MITLTQPIWLLLLVPLGVAWYLWPLPTPLLRFLRAMAIVSLVFAMTQPAIKLPDRSGTVVVIADRSDSMPENAGTRSRETIEMIQQGMSSRDRLGVVAFGQKSLVERAPQAGEFGGFTAQVGTDASSLGDAIESAMALIPTETPGRIIVVSDGKWTGRDPGTIAARAA
ncbi:MAG: VWA domain-containing protein, partial [Verrucomicrobiia bacterium]